MKTTNLVMLALVCACMAIFGCSKQEFESETGQQMLDHTPQSAISASDIPIRIYLRHRGDQSDEYYEQHGCCMWCPIGWCPCPGMICFTVGMASVDDPMTGDWVGLPSSEIGTATFFVDNSNDITLEFDQETAISVSGLDPTKKYLEVPADYAVPGDLCDDLGVSSITLMEGMYEADMSAGPYGSVTIPATIVE